MANKPKNRRPTQLEIWKGIRKDPVPPGRAIQPQDRAKLDEADEDEMRQWSGWRGGPLEDYDDYED